MNGNQSFAAMELGGLRELARSLGIRGISQTHKPQFIEAIQENQMAQGFGSKQTGAGSPQELESAPAGAKGNLEQLSKESGKKGARRDLKESGKEDSLETLPTREHTRQRTSASAGEPEHGSEVKLDVKAAPEHDLGAAPSRKESLDAGMEELESIPVLEAVANKASAKRESNQEHSERFERHNRNQGRGRNRNRNHNQGRERDENDSSSSSSGDEELSPEEILLIAGILDIKENHAFVRTSGCLLGSSNIYVTLGQVRRQGLRPGDAIVEAIRKPHKGEVQRVKHNALVHLESVSRLTIEEAQGRAQFKKPTPLYPDEQLHLETNARAVASWMIGLMAPIGKGQRGSIVLPPGAGKTIVLQQIANVISINNPEIHIMVALVDERPEEVTDIQYTVKGEAVASTFDRPVNERMTVTELAIERTKRLVELGGDVVVLLDSITRLGRAYNLTAPASGRILSGGVDASALYPPKRFFGAARNAESGGSLTILAATLVKAGSKMDEMIFEEFENTDNMKLRPSRELSEKRIYPAVDVSASGTRHEEVLLTKEELAIMWRLRRLMAGLETQTATGLVLKKLRDTQSNAEFLMVMAGTTPAEQDTAGLVQE